jgi:putative addiction module antidote
MLTFKLTKVGQSDAFIIDETAKLALNIQEGDTVYLTEATGGAMRITPFDPDFARQMRLAESVMDADRDILKILAK